MGLELGFGFWLGLHLSPATSRSCLVMIRGFRRVRVGIGLGSELKGKD